MKTRAFLLPLMAVLAASAGCAYGTGDELADEALESEAVLLEPVSREPGPTALPVAGGTAGEPDPAEAEAAGPAATAPTRPPADCIDLSGGTPRLVPCPALGVVRTAPAGHDDPDPWRPLANPGTPTR